MVAIGWTWSVYAESRGHEFDEDVPGATHYRNYVIRALNEDVPYDQFITEQIAGDLIPKPRLDPVSRLERVADRDRFLALGGMGAFTRGFSQR